MSAKPSQTIFPAHVSVRRPPLFLDPADAFLFQREFNYAVRSTTVDVLKNALVVSGDAVVDTKGMRFRDDATHVHALTRRQKLRKLIDLIKPWAKVDAGTWITDNWSNGYFHWMTDALPRALAAERMGKGHPLLLTTAYMGSRFVVDSLDILGIPGRYFDAGQCLRVGELVLPSHAASTGNYNRTLVQELRVRMTQPPATSPDRRVYISRANAARRTVLNESLILPMLKRHGFEVHRFEEYGLREQITLMQGTSVLMGLHGAGLTNMLFMPAGGHVLEIRNRHDAANNCYFALTSDMDHTYDYLLADGNTADTHVVDVTVNEAALERVLARIPTR